MSEYYMTKDTAKYSEGWYELWSKKPFFSFENWRPGYGETKSHMTRLSEDAIPEELRMPGGIRSIRKVKLTLEAI